MLLAESCERSATKSTGTRSCDHEPPLAFATPYIYALVTAANERAQIRFWEFFVSNIRNPYTRRACARGAGFSRLVRTARRQIDHRGAAVACRRPCRNAQAQPERAGRQARDGGENRKHAQTMAASVEPCASFAKETGFPCNRTPRDSVLIWISIEFVIENNSRSRWREQCEKSL
jgi:hypothetical protein